jgi:UPF0716 protein FxsA
VAPLLVLLFLVVPILEIWIIVQVGQVIGVVPTIVLLVVESLLGAWLVRREGRRTWRALQLALRSGRMPGRELLDGGLVLVGGTLLLTPGFATDVVGFFLVLPVTRPVARRVVTAVLARRVLPVRRRRGFPSSTRAPYPPPGPRPNQRVVRGEVADGEERRP